MRLFSIASIGVAATALLALGAGPTITVSPLFGVERIAIDGLNLLEKDEILALSGIERGANLYRIDMDKVGGRIEAHPMVKSVRIVRTPPDGARITVVERRPIALVSLEAVCGIDEEGVLLPFHPSFVDLPIITGVDLDSYSLGRPAQEEGLLRCLELLRGARNDAPDLWDQISEVRPDPDMVVIHLVGDGLEIRMNPLDVATQHEKLQALLRGGRWSSVPRYIDLRFEGQVVTGQTEAHGGKAEDLHS